MKPNLLPFTLTALLSLSALSAATVTAAPLPNGTKLGRTMGVGSGPNGPCASGTCFGMEIVPGFTSYADYGGGIDGGFILGKDQGSGGQQIPEGPGLGSPTNSRAGELSTSWNFGGNFGTFFTMPAPGTTNGSSLNLFDDAPCAGADRKSVV